MRSKNKKILANYLNDLRKVDSLEELDKLINKITNTTNSTCSDFRCKSGCFTCCKGSNVPPVYAKEWQRIRENIKKMPEEIMNQIKENLEHLLNKHSELLQSVNNAHQENLNENEVAKITRNLKNEYSEEICPLHINGECSVYEVRPAICRGFGYFNNRIKNKVELLTCETLADDLHKISSSFAAKSIIFPFWNSFNNKLEDIALDDSEIYEKGIIPFWLKNDFESGKM